MSEQNTSDGLSAAAKRAQETNTQDRTQHTHHCYSTLPTSTTYNLKWISSGGEKDKLHTSVQKLTVHGRAGVPDKFLRTPQGTVTPLTADEAAALLNDPHFKIHEKNGYVKIVKIGEKDPEKIGADMAQDAKSKPLTKKTLNAGVANKDKLEGVNSGGEDNRFTEELS